MATTSNGLLPLKNDINTVWKRVFHEKSNRVEIRPFLKIVMVIMIIIMTIIIIIFFFDFVAISCHLETIAKSFFFMMMMMMMIMVMMIMMMMVTISQVDWVT